MGDIRKNLTLAEYEGLNASEKIVWKHYRIAALAVIRLCETLDIKIRDCLDDLGPILLNHGDAEMKRKIDHLKKDIFHSLAVFEKKFNYEDDVPLHGVDAAAIFLAADQKISGTVHHLFKTLKDSCSEDMELSNTVDVCFSSVNGILDNIKQMLVFARHDQNVYFDNRTRYMAERHGVYYDLDIDPRYCKNHNTEKLLPGNVRNSINELRYKFKKLGYEEIKQNLDVVIKDSRERKAPLAEALFALIESFSASAEELVIADSQMSEGQYKEIMYLKNKLDKAIHDNRELPGADMDIDGVIQCFDSFNYGLAKIGEENPRDFKKFIDYNRQKVSFLGSAYVVWKDADSLPERFRAKEFVKNNKNVCHSIYRECNSVGYLPRKMQKELIKTRKFLNNAMEGIFPEGESEWTRFDLMIEPKTVTISRVTRNLSFVKEDFSQEYCLSNIANVDERLNNIERFIKFLEQNRISDDVFMDEFKKSLPFHQRQSY